MDERWFLYLGLFILVVFFVDGGACGNAVIEEGEVCDVSKMGGENCTNFNYTGGSLECLDDCSGYSFDSCTGEDVCGNGIIGDIEICEPGNVRNRTCIDEGYVNGTLGCSSNCLTYDYGDCGGDKSECGDGVVMNNEECEGGVVGTCESLGFGIGVLNCYSNCTFNKRYCFNLEGVNVTSNETAEINITVNESVEGSVLNESFESNLEEINSEIEENVSKVEGGIILIYWILIALGLFIVGMGFIWYFTFRFKK